MGALSFVRTTLNLLAHKIGRVMSWAAWVPIVLIGSVTGIWLHQTEIVMLLLTIQTSVDAAATKTLQNDVQAAEAKKDAILQQQIADSSSIIIEVRRQNDMLIELMLAAQKRDRLAAKRDSMMLAALEARNNLLDILGKEVLARHDTGKTGRAPSGQRASNGRRTRPKS